MSKTENQKLGHYYLFLVQTSKHVNMVHKRKGHDNSRLSHLRTYLDVLDDASVDGLLEAGIGPAEVVAKVAGLAGGLAEVLVENGRVGHGLVGSGQENDLAVRGLGHRLHGLEVADLHGRSGREDIGGLAHELGRLDLCGEAS